jgi:hypothetical protein
LKEANDLVDGAPKPIKEGVSKYSSMHWSLTLSTSYKVTVLYDRGEVESIRYVDETGCYGFGAWRSKDRCWTIYVPGHRWNAPSKNPREEGDRFKGRRKMSLEEQERILPRIEKELLKKRTWFQSPVQVKTEASEYYSRWDEEGSFQKYLDEIKASIPESKRREVRRENIRNGNRFFLLLGVPVVSAVSACVFSIPWLLLRIVASGAILGLYFSWWYYWYRDAKK